MTHGIRDRMPRVVASIEARMGSSRLPGKSLMDICGEPAMTRLLRRLRLCATLDDIVLATTVAVADDELEKWADFHGVPCYRGSEEDVLGRVVGAQRKLSSDVIVEINGDTILLDPDIIDLGVMTYLYNDCDVVSNTWKSSFPDGIDVQVFGLPQLEAVERTVSDPAIREHVSLYFYENPNKFILKNIEADDLVNRPELRLTVDTEEDFQFISSICKRLLSEGIYPEFDVKDIIRIVDEYKISVINKNIKSKQIR